MEYTILGILQTQRKQQQYVADPNDASEFVLSEIEAYNWLDASVKKTFFKDRFEVMVGARNLLNITEIQNTTATALGNGNHVSTSNIMLGYGTSYFLKLTYNLNF